MVGFHALIEHGVLHIREHVGQILDDLFRAFILGTGHHHAAVELDDVEGELHDTLHIGIAGAEIVQIELQPLCTQLLNLCLHDHEVRLAV